MLLRVRAVDRCLDHHGGMVVVRVDPAEPVDVALDRLGSIVALPSSGDQSWGPSSVRSPPKGTSGALAAPPSSNSLSGGGESFLQRFEVFYRGHNVQRFAGSDKQRAQPFGVVFPAEDGEELLIRRRRVTGVRDVGALATMGDNSADNVSNDCEDASAVAGAADGSSATLVWSPIALEEGQTPLRAYGGGGVTRLFPSSPSDATNVQHPRSAAATTAVVGHLSAFTAPRAQRRLHHAFQQFLERCDGLAAWYGPFAAKDGLFSLGELCGQSAQSLARSLDRATPPTAFLEAIRRPDKTGPTPRFVSVSQSAGAQFEVPFALEVYAHRLISAAHRTMKARGLVIDWPTRLRQYVKHVDPERATGSDVVQSIQIRERLVDAPPDVLDAASSVAMENAWEDLRHQYEAHLVNVIQDAEAKGYRLLPTEDGRTGGPLAVAASGNANGSTRLSDALRPSTVEASGHGDAFVVVCPDCQHAFSYASPTLSQRIQHMQHDMALKESASIAIQKEHAIRVQQLTDAIDALASKLRQSEAARSDSEAVVDMQTQRLRMLEGENHSLRQARVDAQQRSGMAGHSFYPTAGPFTHPDAYPSGTSVVAPTGGGASSSMVGMRTVTPKRTDGATSDGIRERVVRSDRDASSSVPPGHQGTAVADRPPDAAVGSDDRRRIRRVLVDYLERHNPDGVLLVDVILAAWRDREYELERVLRLPPSRAPASLQALARTGVIE